MAKTYKRKSQEEKEREVNELIEKANIGIENSFTTPESLKEFLNYMSKFYNYSLRNASLIQEQFRGALAVGSYAFWKEKGFTVNKGEKGIKILVPNRLSDYFINEKGEEVKLKNATKEEKKLIEKGEIEVRKGKLIFNQGYVFEVTQTNAKAEDLPRIFPGRWLDGEVKNYELMYKAMENIAKKIGVKIIEPKDELGAVKGVSYPTTKEVALNPRNTQLQNVKTLIHELTHAKLHTMETRDNYTTNEKEFQAEMAAYVVCSYFGLDTSEYSFRYIKDWTEGVELKDKEKLVNEVRETVKEYIEVIEETLINAKELSLALEKENNLEKKENIEYDKNLYELKELEVMRNNKELKDIILPKNISKEDLENIINISYKESMTLSKDELRERREILKEIIEINDIKVTSNEKNIEYLIAISEHNYDYALERIDLQQAYNEWRELVGRENWCKLQLASEDIKLKHIESENIQARKDFSKFANLDSEITLDEMLELENIYEENIFQNLANLDKLEEEKYRIDRSKEYETLFDLELRDGSFIKAGTSFIIEGFKDGKYEVHFSDKEGNIYIPDNGTGDMYYFNEFEIEKFTDLSKGEVLFKEQESGVDDWKLSDRDLDNVSFKVMKDTIEELMKENYGDFIKAIISIENNIDDLEILDKVYENYMDNDYGLLNNAIDKAIEFEQENMSGIEIENSKDRTVEVKYSEVPGFIEGEKLTLVETMEKFKTEVESGAVNKAIEFTFSLNENIKYNEEFIIDKGTSVDLIEFIDEKIGDNFYLHELVEEYLKDNDLEFEHKEIVSEKDKKIEKYKENELE